MIETEIEPVVRPTVFRRAIAVAMLFGFGIFLVYLGFGEQSVGLLWKLGFLLFGIGALVMSVVLYRATSVSIRLTDAGLVETGGRILCAFDDIDTVETSAFSFKPTNGILIRTKRPMPTTWAPGLWWRFGRKVGIGGVTSAGEAKAMADIIALRRMKLAEDAAGDS